MIFYNLGDGYSSGCCTVNLCRFAHEDKKYFSMVEREHPDNRPGSFVNQLAELYKASTITEAHHRTTIQKMSDSYSHYEADIRARNEEVIAFIGIPDLQSVYFDDDLQIRTMFGITDDVKFLTHEYLFLDGKDEIYLSQSQENIYLKICEMRDRIAIEPQIAMLEDFIKKISTITKKVVLYRTTHLESLELNLPENVSFLNESIVEILSKTHKPYRKGYFDKLANKTLTKEFLKLI